MKIFARQGPTMFTLSLAISITIFVVMPTLSIGKEASHDHSEHGDHDQPVAHNKSDDHKNHEGHGDHDDHDDHDKHGHDEHGHDEHGHDDNGLIAVDPGMFDEFGIAVQKAGPGTLDHTLRLSGEVVFNADRIAHVTPVVSGVVLEVNHSVGDHVAQNAIMAMMSSRELAAARSEYMAAQARLNLARDNLGRDDRLFADRIGTERQVLESKQVVRENEIALKLAEQSLHALGQSHDEIQAIDQMEDTPLSAYALRAPLDGLVIARELTRGEVVTREPDVAPFVIADLSTVWINLTVYQRDLASVRAGMPVRISFGHGVADAQGTIAFVSPALNETTRTATARVVLSNADGKWRPGMFVTGEVATSSQQSAVVLPRSAIQEVESQQVVFVQTEEGFEMRPVTVGEQTRQAVEIITGIEPGERVVVRNGFSLKAEMNRGALEHAGHAH